MRADLSETPLFCAICTKPIEGKGRRGAPPTVCSPECQNIRRRVIRGREQHPLSCAVCKTEITAKGRKGSPPITCSPEHHMQRQRILRSRADQKFCRYCARPSTPAEHAAFKRWRKAVYIAEGLQQLPALLDLLRTPGWLMGDKDGKVLANALERVFEGKSKEAETSSPVIEPQEVNA